MGPYQTFTFYDSSSIILLRGTQKERDVGGKPIKKESRTRAVERESGNQGKAYVGMETVSHFKRISLEAPALFCLQ
jgi:hypothetical protein